MRRADDTQDSDAVREPPPGAAVPVLHGIEGAQFLNAAPFPSTPVEAAGSAAALVACIPVPAVVCDGDEVIASNSPVARLVGYPLRHGTERGFSRLFAAPHRSRLASAMRLEPGACARLPAATLLTNAGGGRRVALHLAGVELDPQHLTLITVTAAGVPLLEPVSASASHPLDPTRLQTLTPRELEVLDLVTQGLTSKAIAQRLGIGRRTVETHRANLLRKLGLERQVLRPREVRP